MPTRVYVTAHASVRLSAADLDPLDVTRLLRLPPDHTHRRGEPRIVRAANGTVREYTPYAHGLWLMSSERWVSSPRLAVHVDRLLRELEPKGDEVRALLASGVDADIFCYSLGRSSDAPSLPRVLRERAARLGLRIDVDHYPWLPDASTSADGDVPIPQRPRDGWDDAFREMARRGDDLPLDHG